MPLYSNSRLNKFEECPQAYKFKYIDEIETETRQSLYGFLGSRVHETLEEFHKDLKNGKMHSLEDLLDLYRKIWKKNWSEDIEISNNEYSPGEFKEVGEKCIRNYYGKHSPFDEGNTVATELRVHPTIRKNGEEYTFQGLIDRLSIDEQGNFIIHDYKTGKRLPDRDHLKNDRQLPLYQFGVRQKYPNGDNIELVWHYVRFGKDFRFEFDQEDLDKVKEDITQTIQEIEKAKEKDKFPPMRESGAKCEWCDYQEMCPEWRHRYDTGQASMSQYSQVDGAELVDELTNVEKNLDNLEKEKSKLEERKKELENKILEYADRNNITSVYGGEKRASIQEKERIQFPKSNHEKRDDLEELLKERGNWEDVSFLSIRSLAKVYRENEWSEETLEELEEFKDVEDRQKVELKDIDE